MALQHPRNMRDDARKPERAARYHANRCEHFQRMAIKRAEESPVDKVHVEALSNLASHHAMQAFAWAAKG
jgi:hypothetical protein